MIKKIILILVILGIGLALFFAWPSKDQSKKIAVSPINPERKYTQTITQENKPPSAPGQIVLSKKESNKGKKEFSEIEKSNYFQKIRDTIKDQWKELEDCENEFDLNFGELMAMGPKKTIEYLNDPNNLDNFLEKFSTLNMTTPSSAKMIKQLAEPIASEVDKKEILDTVGFVKTCRLVEKSNLLWILSSLKNKNKFIALATISFFENENSTLTYPDILYKQILDLKTFMEDFGLNEKEFPEIAQIENEWKAYHQRTDNIYEAYRKKINKSIKDMSPEEMINFSPETQKEDYDFAVKLQPQIKLLLEKVKEKFI